MRLDGNHEEIQTQSETIDLYLREYLGIEQKDAERIDLLKVKTLSQPYQSQLEFFNDERLDEVTVAVVPDDLWHKGSQPSESAGERQLILVRRSYFEAIENTDEIAWLCHELAHCQAFLDLDSPSEYENYMNKFAFDDLKTEHSYPNNPIERFTFTRQFQYLKGHGKSRGDISALIGGYYEKVDMPFFSRLLDDVFGKEN